MQTRFFISAFLMLSLLISSCSKDDPKDPNEVTNDRLVKHSWEVRSFTADGVETMKVLYNSIDMSFTKEDKTNGRSSWRVINTLAQASNLESKYSVRNQGREIDLDGDLMDISVDDNNLTFKGNVGGERWVIEARKR